MPLVGPAAALGYIGMMATGTLESAVLVGGVCAISAALVGMEMHQDSVLQCRTALTIAGYLVMAHDLPGRIAKACEIGASPVDVHKCLTAPTDPLVAAE